VRKCEPDGEPIWLHQIDGAPHGRWSMSARETGDRASRTAGRSTGCRRRDCHRLCQG
jgi:hypothetical protein